MALEPGNAFYVYTATIAAGATLTSAINISNDKPVMWILEIPAFTGFVVTATCNVRLQGCVTSNGTFRNIGYSNNPATTTSGFRNWEAGSDAGNTWVICEAAQFLPYVKISLTNTATVAAQFTLVGKPVA